MAAPRRDKGDPYTGNALKDGYTCLARRPGPDEVDYYAPYPDEYQASFEELGEYRGRGRRLSSDPDAEDGYFY